MEISETELAYLAGIIDGEGTITLTKNGSQSDLRYPVITVASTSEEIVQYCKDKLGGFISKKKTYEDHHKTSYQWKITYNYCLNALEDLLPYLQEPSKKRRAHLLVNHWKDLTPRNGKYTSKAKEQKLQFQKHFFHPDEFQQWNKS